MNCDKPTRFYSLNRIQVQPAQEKAAFSMENHQSAAQPQIIAPKRGVFGAIRHLFRKNNKADPLNTIQEESTQERAGPSAEDRQAATIPQAPAPKRGVRGGIKRLFKKNKKVEPLNNIQEEPTQERAGPSAKDRQHRGVCRAIRRGVRAAARRIWPIGQPKTRKYTTETDNDPTANNIVPTLEVLSFSESEETPVTLIITEAGPTSQAKTTNDEETEVIPSTEGEETEVIPSTEANQTDMISSTEDEETDVIPSTEDEETEVIPSIEDEETNAIPSTEDEETEVIPSIEDEETEVIPSIEDEETEVIPSTEDEETEVIPSTKDEETKVILSTEDEESEVIPSTKDKQTKVIPSTENEEKEVILSTKDQQLHVLRITRDKQIQVTPPFTKDGKSFSSSSDEATFNRDIESRKSLGTPMPSNTFHGTFPPVPSSSTVLDKPYVLSLENFTFHKVLGQGSHGKVMLASHPSFQQKLAVKIIEKKTASFYDHNEIKILEKFRNHPYITHLFGTIETEIHLFFAMEFVSGGNLRKLIETSAPLDGNTIRCVTAEILCGLQFLHARGVIHRDIKPENILLDSAGHIRIADFGISAIGITESNRIRGVVGTYGYMAPEVSNFLPYSTTADYFSLGVIVYEMAVSAHDIRNKQRGCYLTVPTEITDLEITDDVHLQEIIVLLIQENQETRTHLVRDIRRHPFFERIDWAEVEKGMSPPAFTPKPILKEPEYFRMSMSEFMPREVQGIPIKAKIVDDSICRKEVPVYAEDPEYYEDSSSCSEEVSVDTEDSEYYEDSSIYSE